MQVLSNAGLSDNPTPLARLLAASIADVRAKQREEEEEIERGWAAFELVKIASKIRERGWLADGREDACSVLNEIAEALGLLPEGV